MILKSTFHKSEKECNLSLSLQEKEPDPFVTIDITDGPLTISMAIKLDELFIALSIFRGAWRNREALQYGKKKNEQD